MGGAAAGVKFYCAYPMSPATGVLHWMSQNARDVGIMVRQVEDEIGVANMAVGAAHAGCRTLCATSGGGFALMTEAIGMAGMMEVPVVFINVQRAGPSTGVPTKTEQGDLWQVLGASQGDFQRFIVAPKNALDAFDTMPEVFNLTDKYQCPAIVLSDLLISEGTFSIDPDKMNLHPKIDRGELIDTPSQGNGYMRYKNTKSGISPRALPGLEGYVHIVATDEHDEDSISDQRRVHQSPQAADDGRKTGPKIQRHREGHCSAAAGGSGGCPGHAHRMGIHLRCHQGGGGAVEPPGGYRQSASHQMDRSPSRRGGE